MIIIEALLSNGTIIDLGQDYLESRVQATSERNERIKWEKKVGELEKVLGAHQCRIDELAEKLRELRNKNDEKSDELRQVLERNNGLSNKCDDNETIRIRLESLVKYLLVEGKNKRILGSKIACALKRAQDLRHPAYSEADLLNRINNCQCQGCDPLIF